MSYAERIKKLREKLIVSQKELGDILGVSYVTVNRWETGKFEPTIKMKRKIVELCKINGIALKEI